MIMDQWFAVVLYLEADVSLVPVLPFSSTTNNSSCPQGSVGSTLQATLHHAGCVRPFPGAPLSDNGTRAHLGHCTCDSSKDLQLIIPGFSILFTLFNLFFARTSGPDQSVLSTKTGLRALDHRSKRVRMMAEIRVMSDGDPKFQRANIAALNS